MAKYMLNRCPTVELYTHTLLSKFYFEIESHKVLSSLCNLSRALAFNPTTLTSQVAGLIFFLGSSYYQSYIFKITGSDNKYNIQPISFSVLNKDHRVLCKTQSTLWGSLSF